MHHKYTGQPKRRHMKITKVSGKNIYQTITKSPWCISNITLHKDFHMPTVNDRIRTHCKKFHSNLCGHTNKLTQNKAMSLKILQR